jgi:hypothetical protein
MRKTMGAEAQREKRRYSYFIILLVIVLIPVTFCYTIMCGCVSEFV